MNYGFSFGYLGSGGGGMSGGGTTAPAPRVLSSKIDLSTQADGILVSWNLHMMMSCDLKNQINVIIDGGAPVHPKAIEFHPHDPSQMGLIMDVPFTPGQSVTWAYADNGPCDLHQVGEPTNEADNQTYIATLSSSIQPTNRAFSSGFAIGFK